MDQTSINYKLYIPRVALSSSSSSSKASSRFKDFAVERGAKNDELWENSGESESEGVSSIQNDDAVRANRNRMYTVYKATKPVSKSDSNQNSFTSSNASNHSNYSVNSLLLSVKNLENFNKATSQLNRKPSKIYSEVNPNVILKSNFYNDYLVANDSNRYPIKEYRSNMLQNIKSISSNNLHSVVSKQEKDVDAVSMTSSNTTTNFTVVSLNDIHQRLNKSKAICRRSRQISILIIIMTVLFIILIAFMLVLLDMRNQKMPR